MLKLQSILGVGVFVFLFPIVVQAAVDVEDISPPQIISASITPPVVNTSGAPATLTLTLHITDDLSGTVHAFYRFEPANPLVDGQFVDAVIYIPDEKCTGVATDLLCDIPFTLPRYAAGGEWVPVWMYTRDAVGNRFSISYESITTQTPGYVSFINDTDAPPTRYIYVPIVAR